MMKLTLSRVSTLLAIPAALATLTTAPARATTPASACPARCEGQWQDRALLLASGDTYGDVDLSWNLCAVRWARPPSGLQATTVDEDGEPWPDVVNTPRDVAMLLRWAAERCYRIKYMGIFSHGSEGAIYFNHQSLSFEDLSMFDGLDCVMAPDATINFSGCNVGRGCDGQNFMAAVAGKLLTKGGQVQANTYYSSTFIPGVLPHFSLNGDRQLLHVRPGANGRAEIDTTQGEDGWDNDPIPASTCRSTLSDCRSRLSAQHTRLSSCTLTADQRVLVDSAANLVTQFDAVTSEADGSFTPSLRGEDVARMGRNRALLSNCEAHVNTLEDYECGAPGTAPPPGGTGAQPAQ